MCVCVCVSMCVRTLCVHVCKPNTPLSKGNGQNVVPSRQVCVCVCVCVSKHVRACVRACVHPCVGGHRPIHLVRVACINFTVNR